MIKPCNKTRISSYDAAYLASAERVKSDIFLTTDDRLFKKAQNYNQFLNVTVSNLLQWLAQIIQMEQNSDENPE